MTTLKANNTRSRRSGGLLHIALGVLAASLLPADAASAQTVTTLANFNGTDGLAPYGTLIADANGNLFGTTGGDGASLYGTVFEIAKTATGYAATPTTLVSFNGTDGAEPAVGLIADANGNLFGTTLKGGAFGYGTVFEVAETANGYAATPTTLVSFNNSDGADPYAGLMADANGNLFGTTVEGGAGPGDGAGTLFEIARTASGYAASPITLVDFNNSATFAPAGALFADANGNLFGTALGGGAFGYGTVFEIAKTASGYATQPTILASFNGTDGGLVYSGVIADSSGNLFGTTAQGGAFADGTVFEVAKTATGYAASPTVLVSFNGNDGASPYSGLIADADGSLFGTTPLGGASGEGTVFEIAKTSAGYSASPTILASFNASAGNNRYSGPYGGLIADANGNLFGTTIGGGPFNAGTVFELSGSGFVPPRQFAGAPGSANCNGVATSTLAKVYGGTAHAAAALGYNSVAALQSAIAAYCAP